MDFSIRLGTVADISACLAIDSGIAADWVLHVEQSGATPELGFGLRWRPMADGRRRDFALDVDFYRSRMERGARLLVAQVDMAVRGRMLVCEK
jgi:hypothetical protein